MNKTYTPITDGGENNMAKSKYISPNIYVVMITRCDIITTSNDIDGVNWQNWWGDEAGNEF